MTEEAKVNKYEGVRTGILYPHNVLEGYGNGALLDLRVRFAMALLEKSPIFQSIAVNTPGKEYAKLPQALALLALDTAEALLVEAEARGWVEALPEDADLTQALRDQAKRTASFQALQQMEGNKFVQDEQGKLVPAAPVMPRRGH